MGYLIVLHLESESTHAHWSGRGSQFASRSADGLVASRRLQNLGIITKSGNNHNIIHTRTQYPHVEHYQHVWMYTYNVHVQYMYM